MVKKFLFLVAMVMLGVQSLCVADPGSFEFYAEYLLMRNSRSLPFFAAPENGNGQLYANRSSWHSGYRLEGAYRFCPNDGIHLRWMQFPQFSDSRTINNGQLVREIVGATNSGTAISDHVKSSLYNLELFYMHDFHFCTPLSLSLLAGVQYSHIHIMEKVKVFGGTPVLLLVGEDIFHSSREGIGPELGINLGYSFCSCLSAEMRTSGSWMIAHRGEKLNEPIIPLKLQEDPIWVVLPYFDMRLGLDYHGKCWNVQVGYEILSYLQGISRFYFFNLSDLYENLSMYGFYFQVGCLF
jgi:hypothetical protein